MSASLQVYWQLIIELFRTPFHHSELIWGIVPLYFGWLVNELTSGEASFKTAIQTGFSFVWAAAHWIYQYSVLNAFARHVSMKNLLAVNVVVTLLVLMVGLLAFVSGLRGKYPKYCSFLGHSRFSNYFMIAIFPIQSNYLGWTRGRLLAILIFSIPVWLLASGLAFAVRPGKKKK